MQRLTYKRAFATQVSILFSIFGVQNRGLENFPCCTGYGAGCGRRGLFAGLLTFGLDLGGQPLICPGLESKGSMLGSLQGEIYEKALQGFALGMAGGPFGPDFPCREPLLLHPKPQTSSRSPDLEPKSEVRKPNPERGAQEREPFPSPGGGPDLKMRGSH